MSDVSAVFDDDLDDDLEDDVDDEADGADLEDEDLEPLDVDRR